MTVLTTSLRRLLTAPPPSSRRRATPVSSLLHPGHPIPTANLQEAPLTGRDLIGDLDPGWLIWRDHLEREHATHRRVA